MTIPKRTKSPPPAPDVRGVDADCRICGKLIFHHRKKYWRRGDKTIGPICSECLNRLRFGLGGLTDAETA